jgi:hypothetical protein
LMNATVWGRAFAADYATAIQPRNEKAA